MAQKNDDDLSEIDFLKERYECKVIENIGSYKFIVTIYLENKRVSVKFQISRNYPETPPEVVTNGLEWGSHDLEKFLTETKNLTMITILKFVEDSIGNGGALLKDPTTLSQKKSRRKSPKKAQETDSPENEKKVSMRTAEDVVKRIRWDPQLKAGDFIVGYLDRFLGIVENNFTVFNWDNFASVDYTDTAIPKHRIHYFKYKSDVVWDKTKRIDNVFGSTGSGLTILDVVENFVETEDAGRDAIDDRVEVVTFPSETKSQKKRRPNYFICQRVRDEKILDAIQEVQRKMLATDSSFEEYVVPRGRIHLTLCTFGLYTKEDLDLLCKILQAGTSELVDIASEISLEVKNIEQFFNRVVYCKISANEKLLEFVEYLKMIVQAEGLRTCDAFEFVPHVTLMKVVRGESLRTIPRRIYGEFEDTFFGHLSIDELSLCEISKEHEEDGFYKSHFKLELK